MKVVVFDFDGVIIPSEEIKQNAYEWIFSDFGEEVPREAILASRDEFANAKGNRYDIIRGIFRRVGGVADIEEVVREYSERFSVIVKKRIQELAVEPKIREMLDRLSMRHALYINSNNPDEPLKETLEALGIEHLFKGVYGSSRRKVENLTKIAESESVSPDEMVFIGDGEGDKEAAKEFGCEFIGVATSLNGWKDGTSEFKVLQTVSELDQQKRGGFERMK
jgi:phosphoglycolate phosphatase-like HAD superfamily hydrolase